MTDFLSDLEKKREELQRQNQQADRAVAVSREISDLQREIDRKLGRAGDSIKGAPLSGLERLFKAASSLSFGNASIMAGEAGVRDLGNIAPTFAKTYLEDVKRDLQSAWTGREARTRPKLTGADMLKMAGMTSNKGELNLSDVLGFGFDMGQDPTNLGITKKAFSVIGDVTGKLGSQLAPLMSKVPVIQKGIDKFGESFNLFYWIEKELSPQDFKAFKEAFTVAANTGDKWALKQFGTPGMSLTHGAGGFQTTGRYVSSLDTTFSDKMGAALAEAFDTQRGGGFFDKFTTLYKQYVTAAFPTFHGRNALDSLITNFGMEGVKIQDYVKWFSEKNLPGVADMVKRFGVSGQSMIGTAQSASLWQQIKNLPMTVAEGIETNLARGPLMMKKIREGMSDWDSAEYATKVFGQYNDKFFTSFEKWFSTFGDIWYKFDKKQATYWSGAIVDKIARVAGFGKLATAAEDEQYKDKPWSKPSWMKEQFALGSWAGFGSSLEDFMKMVTGDFKAISMKAQPIFEKGLELVTDYKVYSEKQLSKDTGGSDYKNAAGWLKTIVGYNEGANTVNPYMRWIVESIGARFLTSYLTLEKEGKGISSLLFPVKKYDYTKEQLANFQAMQSGKQTPDLLWWMRTQNAGGAQLPPIFPYTIPADDRRRQAITDWERTPQGIAGGYYTTPMVPPSTEAGRAAYLGKQIEVAALEGKAAEGAAKNIGEMIALSFKNKIAEYTAKATLAGRSPQEIKATVDNYMKQYDIERPRKVTEEGYFKEGELRGTKRLLSERDRRGDFNKAQDELTLMTSEIATRFREGLYKDSFKAIEILTKAEWESWQTKVQTKQIQMSPETMEKMRLAIEAQAEKLMEDLNQKLRQAAAESLSDWAEAEVDGIRKIEAERIAALAKFEASDRKRQWAANNMWEEIRNANDAINAKFDQKRMERLAYEARRHSDFVAQTEKEMVQAMQSKLSVAFEAGTMSLETMFGKQREVAIDSARKTIDEYMKAFLVELERGKGRIKEASSRWEIMPREGFEKTITEDQLSKINERLKKAVSQSDAIDIARRNMTTMGIEGSDLLLRQVVTEHGAPGTMALYEQFFKEISSLVQEIDKSLDERQIESANNKFDQLRKVLISAINNETGLGDTKALDQIAKNVTNTFYGLLKVVDDSQKQLMVAKRKLEEARLQVEQQLATSGLQIAQNAFGKSYYPWLSSFQGGLYPAGTMPNGFEQASFTNSSIFRPFEQYEKFRAQGWEMQKTSFDSETERMVSQLRDQLKGLEDITRTADASERMATTLEAVQDSGALRVKVEGKPSAPEVAMPDTSGYETPGQAGMDIEADSAYETEVAKWDALCDAAEEGSARYSVIEEKVNQLRDQRAAQSKQNQLNWEQATWDGKLQILSSGIQMAQGLFETLYEASGRHNKSMFQLAKAAAIADAAIKLPKAIIGAIDSAGGNPYLAAVYAALTAAMIGAQIGVLAAAMFNPPEGKAKGGLIVGGSGKRDDVPIWTMGGEYVIQQDAVKHYGLGKMEAINNKLLELPDMDFPMPSVSAKQHYAEGGYVVPDTSSRTTGDDGETIQILNILEPELFERYQTSTRGQRTVLNVIAANAYEIKKILR